MPPATVRTCPVRCDAARERYQGEAVMTTLRAQTTCRTLQYHRRIECIQSE